jgi:hypothetical protein
MRPHPLWLLLVEDENGKLQDGDLSADQQRLAADASRCSRVSGWHLCSPDELTRGSGGNGASTSGAAKNASRGSSPEACQLRGLTFGAGRFVIVQMRRDFAVDHVALALANGEQSAPDGFRYRRRDVRQHLPLRDLRSHVG